MSILTAGCRSPNFTNITPMHTEAIPIVISNIAIIIKVLCNEMNPQQMPLANGKQKQNLGSLRDEKL